MAGPRTQREPLRVAVYGFHHPELVSVIEQLMARGVWQVPVWYGRGTAGTWSEDIAAWHLGDWGLDPRKGSGELSRGSPPLPTASADDAAAFDAFLDQVARNPALIDQPFATYRRLWTALLEKFETQLSRQAIERVVFQNLPHEGFEWALYHAARRLGIATLLLYQTVLPHRFCYCWDLLDFGEFNTATADPRYPSVSIERRFEKDLFYMRETASNQAVTGSTTRDRSATWQSARIRWRRRLQAWKSVSGWDRLRGKGPRPIHPEEDYQQNIQQTTRPVDWTRRFVYFPLHLQPELTTATLGDAYRDQLLALEQLRATLDPETWIYVKENPKQTYRWRGPAFFERLRRIPRTRLVDRHADTYRLLRESQFAATVTGTVGWESISGGKPTLVFGRPWYLSLAGVHRFQADGDLPQLAGVRIESAEFQTSLDQLCQRMPVGLVDLAYRPMVPDYTAAENQARLVEFLATSPPPE